MAADYVGDVAIAYDRDLRSVLFERYAIDIVRCATERWVRHTLEIAAGTGIAVRQLHNRGRRMHNRKFFRKDYS